VFEKLTGDDRADGVTPMSLGGLTAPVAEPPVTGSTSTVREGLEHVEDIAEEP
jgi:hypothetical protein